MTATVAARGERSFAPLTRLWELDSGSEAGTHAVGTRGGSMPAELVDLYGGTLALPLRSDRPTIAVNFVSTLDGVVALTGDESSGGGEISGFYEPDRLVMALLR